MKVNELKEKELKGLLTDLFSLKGAKEIFAKHNVEMITKEIEKNGLDEFIKQFKELLNTSKNVSDYKQATMFLDTNINTNKSLLATAEGFMKTMLEGMIQGFETTKKAAAQNFNPLLAKEVKELLHNIVNDEDKKTVEKYINEKDLLNNSDEFIGLVESVELAINERYKDEVEKEVEKPKKKQATVKQEEQVKTEQPKEKKVVEPKVNEDDKNIMEGTGITGLEVLEKQDEPTKEVEKEENLFETSENIDDPMETDSEGDGEFDDIFAGIDIDNIESSMKEDVKKASAENDIFDNDDDEEDVFGDLGEEDF